MNHMPKDEPTGKSATFLLGFAAGVAAMGGAVAVMSTPRTKADKPKAKRNP
jgi:allophanate hydrolase subunit 1